MSKLRGPKVQTTLNVLFDNYEFDTVLDVGCGSCTHAEYFKSKGKKVTATDFVAEKEYVIACDYLDRGFKQHDLVWCSHVLEHQLNVNLFLKKLVHECKDDGVIVINVPPLKDKIVGGHVSLWNSGLLLYNMILVGLDCSEARVGTYGYNCSVITKKKMIEDMPDLTFGEGDIEKLSKYFPFPVKQGFNGKDINHNFK